MFVACMRLNDVSLLPPNWNVCPVAVFAPMVTLVNSLFRQVNVLITLLLLKSSDVILLLLSTTDVNFVLLLRSIAVNKLSLAVNFVNSALASRLMLSN